MLVKGDIPIVKILDPSIVHIVYILDYGLRNSSPSKLNFWNLIWTLRIPPFCLSTSIIPPWYFLLNFPSTVKEDYYIVDGLMCKGNKLWNPLNDKYYYDNYKFGCLYYWSLGFIPMRHCGDSPYDKDAYPWIYLYLNKEFHY